MEDRDVAAQFAATLREARERAGISQEALAAAAGLNRTAVGKVERGEAQPRLATVLRLAGGLGCDPCDLLPEMRWKRASEVGRWE